MSDNTNIRALNDALRTTGQGGRVVLTRGVKAQGEEAVRDILRMVKDYNRFHPDSDPYGEHDFGSFAYRGQEYFWKIDYYDSTMALGSPDPANPDVTKRVLTVMLAREY
jgi:hypothetical protein